MKCELCPRRCGKRPGFCGAGALPRVFRWGPHFGEEPPLTGARGSGCVFFSRCTLKCLYCQNSPWSWEGRGEDKTVPELTAIFRELAVRDRVENWNLVSPTPYLPFIREAVRPLLREGIRLPFVWNSSGYERTETLEEYAELCDWALFDLRYSRNATARAASGAADYVEAARAAVQWAWARRPQGLIVRLLVLPGHADEAIENLAWLATELSNEVPVSVMSQYTPAYRALATPPFDRGVTAEEYEAVTAAAADFGFERGWTQGFGAADPRLALLGENMPAAHGVVR
ncbi:MAG: radical SAM protein [Kiritimatiellia bacterium]